MTCWKKRKSKERRWKSGSKGKDEGAILKLKPGIAIYSKKVSKGVRRMPWLSEAKKDVISCDKLRGGANNC